MKKYILGILLLSSVAPVFADGHHSAEKKVIATDESSNIPNIYFFMVNFP